MNVFEEACFLLEKAASSLFAASNESLAYNRVAPVTSCSEWDRLASNINQFLDRVKKSKGEG